MILENKKYLSFSHNLADITGKVLVKNYKSQNIKKSTKNPFISKELVTNVDIMVENVVRDQIYSNFPSHNILGEEQGFTDKGSDFTWIVDPIDGTKAFASGIPLFGFMISLKFQNKIILGLVDQPILKERYWNTSNSSFLNKKKINTSKITNLSDATLTCTDPNMFSNFNELNKILFRKFNYVRWGTDVMGYLRCAEGLVDAVIEREIKIWDIAAVEPIIRNAGGIITTWDGKSIGVNDTVCASNNITMHKTLLKNLQKFI